MRGAYTRPFAPSERTTPLLQRAKGHTRTHAPQRHGVARPFPVRARHAPSGDPHVHSSAGDSQPTSAPRLPLLHAGAGIWRCQGGVAAHEEGWAACMPLMRYSLLKLCPANLPTPSQ